MAILAKYQHIPVYCLEESITIHLSLLEENGWLSGMLAQMSSTAEQWIFLNHKVFRYDLV